jgi:hypothetical protein
MRRNTAPGHFDRKQYQSVKVARPSEFLNVPEVGRLVKKLIRDWIRPSLRRLRSKGADLRVVANMSPTASPELTGSSRRRGAR